MFTSTALEKLAQMNTRSVKYIRMMSKMLQWSTAMYGIIGDGRCVFTYYLKVNEFLPENMVDLLFQSEDFMVEDIEFH